MRGGGFRRKASVCNGQLYEWGHAKWQGEHCPLATGEDYNKEKLPPGQQVLGNMLSIVPLNCSKSEMQLM